MQINNVLSQQKDNKTWSKAAQAFDNVARRGLGLVTGRSSASAGASLALGQVVSQYDVHNITPQKLSEMVQKLRDSGALNEAETRDLTQVRADLDSSGIQPNQTLDLVNFYSQRVQTLQNQSSDPAVQLATDTSGLQQSLAAAQRRGEWMQKLAAMHQTSDAVGMNAVV